jgi:mono/diheme cytochrome c family protein
MVSNSGKRLAVVTAMAAFLVISSTSLLTGSEPVNFLLGQKDAIEQGRKIYRSRCYICHLSNGGRGPNLFQSKLSDYKFLETATNGRRTMPAFGTILMPDEIWAVHAYVKSADHYE